MFNVIGLNTTSCVWHVMCRRILKIKKQENKNKITLTEIKGMVNSAERNIRILDIGNIQRPNSLFVVMTVDK